MTIKKSYLVAGAMALLLSTSISAANPLLDLLVEKEYLTPAEATDIASQMPTPLVWKGDVRLRYQIDKKDSQSTSQERARFRLRLGTEAKVNEDTKAYFQFASGGSADARSNNQTFGPGESFYSPVITLAYIKHHFDDNNAILAGKMTKPFWAPSNMIWDGDINPDGLAYQWKAQAPFTEYFVNAAYFFLGDSSGTSIRTTAGKSGPSLSLIQPGVSYAIDKNTSVKLALSYYMTNNLVGATASSNSGISNGKDYLNGGGNTVLSNKVVYDYNPLVLSGELKYKSFFGFDFASFYGEWAKNTAVGIDDQSGVLGFNFGTEKVKKPGEWQGQLSYRYIQKDSILDILPDSDYYGGNTGVQGFRSGLQYGLANNTTLGASWFIFEKLSNGAGDAQNLAQLDVQVDF